MRPSTRGIARARPFRLRSGRASAAGEIYTLSLHDALPILQMLHGSGVETHFVMSKWGARTLTHETQYSLKDVQNLATHSRSEEHTSELQSRLHLVCRLLLEKKKG